MEYTYLGTSLPKLATQELSAERNIEIIHAHIYSLLNEDDQKQFLYLILKNDNKNLLHILRKRKHILVEPYFTFHKPCFYTYQELEDGINGSKPLHKYMRDFLDQFSSGYEERGLENLLIELYYKEAIDSCEDFLSNYFQFKISVKNIISAINSRKFGYSISNCLIKIGSLVDTLQISNSEDLGLGKSFPFIEDLSKTIEEGNFKVLERKIDSIYIRYLNLNSTTDPFSGDAIFLYFIKLMIGSRWIPLKEDIGREEINRNLEWIVNSANFMDN